MGNVATIGYVVDKGGGRWEWIIPELPSRRMNAFFDSPVFNAEGGRWFLQILPNKIGNVTQILLCRMSFFKRKSLSCTMGVKRADHSEQTMGTKTCKGFSTCYEGGWLHGGELTITLLFRGAHASKEDTTSIPRYIRTEHSASAIDQNSRRDVSKTPEAKANRKVCSRETQTDIRIGKDERLENYTSTATKGVIQLSENLKRLLTEEDEDCDVKIFVKGQEFRAHRWVLKARSPVLNMMLKHDSKEKNSGTINIQDCDPDCFEAFLLFLYSGRTENLDTSKALGLYYVADKYDLPLLKEECATFLETSLSATSVCDVLHLAATHGEKRLLEAATEFFVKNIHEILPTAEWQSFMHHNTDQANELYMNALKSICPQN